MIRVVHLWIGDSPAYGGGGAGSMFRLHTNLRRQGLDSRILCEKKTSDDPYVETIPSLSRGEAILRRFTSRLGFNDIHRLSSFHLKNHQTFDQADVVNFHGLLNGFVNFLALPSLSEQHNVVVTLRSMWCFTGHCAFSIDCDKWKTGCGGCPHLDYYPPVRRDSTAIEWKLKKWSYSRSKLTIVALSDWLATQARQSILSHFPIHTIHNGVDTEAYRPLDTAMCKDLLCVPPGKKVLMFMAVSNNNYRKGGDLLLEALKSLPGELRNQTVLLLVGNQGSSLARQSGMETIDLGYVSSRRLKAIAYNAADIFVMPTRGESFGQVALESQACGTPVVSYAVGPIPEVVHHGETGFLAKPESGEDLGRWISELLFDDALRASMGLKGRDLAIKKFSIDRETASYQALYQSLLGGKGMRDIC